MTGSVPVPSAGLRRARHRHGKIRIVEGSRPATFAGASRRAPEGARTIGTSTPRRYGPLLATLSVIAAFGPALADLHRGEWLIAALFTALMLCCAHAVGHVPATRRRVLGLALVVIAADASLALHTGLPWVLAVGTLRAAFLGFVAAAILVHLVRTERVTHDTILGDGCVYLLMGLCFQSIFGMIERAHPGSFEHGGVAGSALPGADRLHGRYPALVYYSFVTLSTVGYGDFTPTWSLPQALSAAEAILGQLYLAILVASLVGMRLAAGPSERGGS